MGESQHSSCVVDIFATIRSAVDVLTSLDWKSEEDAAGFASDLAAVSGWLLLWATTSLTAYFWFKVVSQVMLRYSDRLRLRFSQCLDNERSGHATHDGPEDWLSRAGIKPRSDIEVKPFNFSPEVCKFPYKSVGD